MGKILEKKQINLLAGYGQAQHTSAKKIGMVFGVIGFLFVASLYLWLIKPQQNQLRYAQKQTQVLQKQIQELTTQQKNEIIPAPFIVRDSITLQQQNADLREVIQKIAASGGRNVLLHEKVQGTITVSLEEVPWRTALDVVLEMSDLIAQERENVLLIRTEQDVIERAQMELLQITAR